MYVQQHMYFIKHSMCNIIRKYLQGDAFTTVNCFHFYLCTRGKVYDFNVSAVEIVRGS